MFALTRSRERRVSQEAVIGVVYAVSAAAAVLVADRTPHGAEHLRSMLVGSILAVQGREVVKVACLYAVIGLFHWLCRRPFLLISTNPDKAYEDGWRVRGWDFLFYASFGVVVTSSVRIAGVLLVFSYLIVPTLAANLLGGSVGRRLAVAWGFGTFVSVVAMAASAILDLPTGRDGSLRLRAHPARPGGGDAGNRRRGPGVRDTRAATLSCWPSSRPWPRRAASRRPRPTASRSSSRASIPMYEFARQVAGDRARVVSLVPAGAEPHDWEPSPQDMAEIRRARLFVYNGAGLEPWADKAQGRDRQQGDRRRQRKRGNPARGRRSPRLARSLRSPAREVETIRAALARLDPGGAEVYAAQAKAFAAKLDALDERFAAGLRDCARRDVVVSHAAFGYLTRRYHLEQVPVMGLAPRVRAEPGRARRHRPARAAAQGRGRLLRDAGEPAPGRHPRHARSEPAPLLLNPIEGLTREEAAAGKGYLDLMEANLANLREGLGCR